MLPSMPILFTRDSQDAFGNKIEPSTSFYDPGTIFINEQIPKQVEEQKSVSNSEEAKLSVLANKPNEEPIVFDENTYENALVSTYFNKVAKRFAHTQTSKFVQFQELLKTFDQTKETPIDLYRKVESLLGEENSDLIEEFLLFLTPSQAVEVGRFSDHLMMTRMSKFLHLLQNTFFRKPTMLRRIIQAITNCMKCDNIKEMRRKVLPLLRSNPRLVQMFRVLFPDEPIPDSLYEGNTDMVSDSFLTDDKGYDVWEFNDPPDSRRNLCAKKDIDTMYLQGRVFLQYGKMLKASRVTYPYSKEPYRVHMQRLAPSHCRLSPTLSDEEAQKTKAKRSKKHKPRAALVKDVNDNNKQLESKLTESPKAKAKKKLKNEVKIDVHKKKDNVSKLKKQKLDVDLKCKTDSVDNKKEDVVKAKKVRFDVDVKSDNKGDVKIDEDVKIVNGDANENKWTRDEDKIMLQILQGEARSDALFCKVRELLPHRSMSDIQERFLHVINLLQQMAGSEVT